MIPKSTSPSHLRSNLDVVDWELPQSDYDALCKLPYQVTPGVVTCTCLHIGPTREEVTVSNMPACIQGLVEAVTVA